MNCNEIRELISCMLDDQLSAEDSAIVAEHLAECPECMRVFEAFHTISITLEELEDVPAGFTEDVMNRIHQSNIKPIPKKRPIRIFRTAGMVATAACVALVLMAGTRFSSTHMYVGGGTGDTAEFVQLNRATPTPEFVEDQIALLSEDESEALEDGTTKMGAIGEAAVQEAKDPVSNITEDLPTATPVAVEISTAPGENDSHSQVTTPAVTSAPQPTVTPTPMPYMDLLFATDLLVVMEKADFELFTEYPAYEVTVTAEDGSEVELKIWLDGERIYCKNEAEGTAWYTVGTPAQLAVLFGEPAAVPTPAVTATPNLAENSAEESN